MKSIGVDSRKKKHPLIAVVGCKSSALKKKKKRQGEIQYTRIESMPIVQTVVVFGVKRSEKRHTHV